MDYFMESLVTNLSPYASPLHSSSPVKGKRNQAVTSKKTIQSSAPDLVDEESVDIYGDMLEAGGSLTQQNYKDELSNARVESASSSSNSHQGKMDQRAPRGSPSKDRNDQGKRRVDSFTGSLSSDKCEMEKMKQRIEELTLLNNKLKTENDVLAANKLQLTKNISCLFLTSRNEIKRKDKEIEELSVTVKELQTISKEKKYSIKADTEDSRGTSSTLNTQNRSRPLNQTSEIQQKLLAMSRDKEIPRTNVRSSSEKVEPCVVDGEDLSNNRSSKSRSEKRQCNKSSRSSSDKSISPDCNRLKEVLKKDYNERNDKERKSDRHRELESKVSPHVDKGLRSKKDGGRESASNSSQHLDSKLASSSKVSLNKSSGKTHVSKSDVGNHFQKNCNDPIKDKISIPKEMKSSSKLPKSMPKESNKDCNERKDPKKSERKSDQLAICQSSKIDKTIPSHSTTEAVISCGTHPSELSVKETANKSKDNASCQKSSKLKQSQTCERESQKINDSEKGKEVANERVSPGEKKDDINAVQEFRSTTVASRLAVAELPQNILSTSVHKGEPKNNSPLNNDELFSRNDTNQNKYRVVLDLEKSDLQFSDILKSGGSLSHKIPDHDPSQNKSEGIALTSCVVSNQDWAVTMSPNASLPFSKMKSPDHSISKEVSNHNTNTNSQMQTNQTWPFENREATNTCSESLMSKIEKPVTQNQETCSERLTSKSRDHIRAFPISDLKDGSDSLSHQSTDQLLFTKDEGNCVSDKKSNSKSSESKSSSAISEEATSSSSAGGEASSKESSSTSKTTDMTSNESEKSSSSSSNVTVVHKTINFLSPLKSGFSWNPNPMQHEDITNMTPPKPKYTKQSTPVKLPLTDYDSSTLTPSKSDNILCTPNLIVLGDEEATCATMMSPFKSTFVPSEFIPPGVRKEMKEVNTHFRHIRGKPEYLHTSPASTGSPDDKSKTNFGLLPSDLGFQKIGFVVKKAVKCKAGGAKEKASLGKDVSVEQRKSDVGGVEIEGNISGDIDRGVERDKNKNICDASAAGGGGPSTIQQSLIEPIVKMAFERVFRKNMLDFKQEMAAKSSSKTNRRVLASRLKRSAQSMKSSSALARHRMTAVEDIPSLSANVRKEVDVDKQRHTTEVDTKGIAERGNFKKCPDLSHVLNTSAERQNNFVNEWVWHTSFNVKPPKQVKSVSAVSKSMHQPNLNSKMEPTADDEISQELTFKGKIPATTSKTAEESQSFTKLQVSEKIGRNMPVSPTNSCRVTSSVEFTEHEIQSERQDSSRTNVHLHYGFEALNSPEPDSTSEPVIFNRCTEAKPHASSSKNSLGVKTASNSARAINKLKQAHSPDSPTKALVPPNSFSKSPRKRAGDSESCSSQCRTVSVTTCSGEEKFDASQVESDLFLSSENDDDTDNETLNATFVISKDQSESESENRNNMLSPQRVIRGKKGGKTPLGGWDEMSLSESQSLSEFDRDVVSPQQHPQVGTTRMSSRTTSFSSHVSVGGFSPFSLSSPKLTPSHIRSPKDPLWSPFNRSSESHDSCHEDVRTPTNRGNIDAEERKGIVQTGSGMLIASPSYDDDDADGVQLSKLFSLQDLQQMELVKTRYGIESSDSDDESSSSSDDESGDSGSESEDEDLPRKDGETVSSPFKSPLKRGKLTPIKSPLKCILSPIKSPLKCGRKIVSSSSKSPLKRAITSGEITKVIRSPRVSRIRDESFHPVTSHSEQPVVCRHSPRKQVQKLKYPENVAKDERGSNTSPRFDNKGIVSSQRHSPRKKINNDDNSKVSQRKSLARDELLANEEKDESGRIDELTKDLKYVQNSPQKSVRIVDESSSGESIVTGSVSKENDVLLKRLCVTDSELGARRRKSPSVKNSGSSNSAGDSPQLCARMEGGRKVENGKSMDQNKIESPRDVSSKSDKRPLSLQEDDNIDPLLMSRRAEFVHNVIKVSRRLDLDKTRMSKVAADDSDEKFDEIDTVCQSEFMDKSPVVEEKPGMSCDDNRRMYDTTEAGSEGIAVIAESDNLVCVDEVGCVDDDGVEDGEIVDEEEEVRGNEEICQNKDRLRQSKPSGEQAQNKVLGNDRLHITQDGCKVIAPNSKLMSRQRGKNFARGKDSSGHGISPMGKVYTPPPSSSSRSEGRKEKLNDRKSNRNKRMRSLSPMSPDDRKRPRVEGNDKPSTSQDYTAKKNLRGHLPSNSDRRSSSSGGSRNQSSVSNRNRNRSPRSNNRERSPPRSNNRERSPPRSNNRERSPPRSNNRERSPPRSNNRERSPTRNQQSKHGETDRQSSNRRSSREDKNRSTQHVSEKQKRDVRSGSSDRRSRRDSGSSHESKNTHHGVLLRNSSNSLHSHRVSRDNETHRDRQERHGTVANSEKSRSRSKDHSPSHQRRKQAEKPCSSKAGSSISRSYRNSKDDERCRDRQNRH